MREVRRTREVPTLIENALAGQGCVRECGRMGVVCARMRPNAMPGDFSAGFRRLCCPSWDRGPGVNKERGIFLGRTPPAPSSVPSVAGLGRSRTSLVGGTRESLPGSSVRRGGSVPRVNQNPVLRHPFNLGLLGGCLLLRIHMRFQSPDRNRKTPRRGRAGRGQGPTEPGSTSRDSVP